VTPFSNTPKVLRRARRYLLRAGLDVHRYEPDPADRRRGLIAESQGVSVVLDVGANEGQYGQALRDEGYTGRIVSFEPLSAPFQRMQRAAGDDPRWQCVQVALADESGTVRMNGAENQELSSSMLEWDEAAPITPAPFIGTEEVPQERLDDLGERFLGPRDRLMLKLDVQGYELQVLAGAARTLPQVEVLDIELALKPLYHGQPDYRAMLDHLAREGFALAGVEPGFTDWSTGVMYEFDALFLRR
jgi:FkbM family methyltransferase